MTQSQQDAAYRLDCATKAVQDALNEMNVAIARYREAMKTA